MKHQRKSILKREGISGTDNVGEMRMKNILLLKGNGIYGATGKYVDEFARGFRKLGYNTITLDITQSVYREKLEWAIKNYPIYAVVDCQGWQVKFAPIELFDKKVTYMTYLCDHPIHHCQVLQKVTEDFVLLTLDKKHKDYIKKYYPKFQYIEYVPLSGECPVNLVPYKQRKIDVFFAGSYWKPKKIELKPEDEGNFVLKLRYEVQCYLMQYPEFALEEALEFVLMKYHLQVTKEEFSNIMVEIADIEAENRAYFRDKIVRMLLKEGVSLTVCGEGWEQLSCEGIENLVILRGGYATSRRALGEARIVLNIMPWFKDGFQERIASGMLGGAVVFSDTSKYLEQEFCDGIDVMLYRLDNLSELPLRIKEILLDEQKAFDIAERGQKKIKEQHTWLHRVKQMAEVLENAKGKVYVENFAQGKELEINVEVCESAFIRDLSIVLGKEFNAFDELRVNGYATVKDALYLLDKANYVNLKLRQHCQFEIETEQNLKIATEEIKKDKTFIILVMLVKGMIYKINERLRSKELEELFYADAKYWNKRLYDEILVKVLCKKYEGSNDEEIKEWLEDIQKKAKVSSYSKKLMDTYADFVPNIDYDKTREMIFVWHNEKRLYYPKAFSVEDVYSAYLLARVEQDKDSTHRYLDDDFCVEKNSVVMDIGVKDGLFALDVVDIARKVYLFVYDEMWVEALTYTFEPYKDKVMIYSKMPDANINEVIGEDEVNFIKIDAENADTEILPWAKATLSRNANIKCAVVTCYKKDMEKHVKQFFLEMDFSVKHTEGYLFYKDYSVPVWENEFRHGVVRAEK